MGVRGFWEKSPPERGLGVFDWGSGCVMRRRAPGLPSGFVRARTPRVRHQITMLMILPGTTITFFGVLPSTHFCASGALTTSA